MTLHRPDRCDPLHNLWACLASHRVSLTKCEHFPYKQEISFICKKNGFSSVGFSLRCWQVTGFVGRAVGDTSDLVGLPDLVPSSETLLLLLLSLPLPTMCLPPLATGGGEE